MSFRLPRLSQINCPVNIPLIFDFVIRYCVSLQSLPVRGRADGTMERGSGGCMRPLWIALSLLACVSAPVLAESCPGNPDAIGTSRIIT